MPSWLRAMARGAGSVAVALVAIRQAGAPIPWLSVGLVLLVPFAAAILLILGRLAEQVPRTLRRKR